MKNFIGKILCKIGIHKKVTVVDFGTANWSPLAWERVECERCSKYFRK